MRLVASPAFSSASRFRPEVRLLRIGLRGLQACSGLGESLLRGVETRGELSDLLLRGLCTDLGLFALGLDREEPRSGGGRLLLLDLEALAEV